MGKIGYKKSFNFRIPWIIRFHIYITYSGSKRLKLRDTRKLLCSISPITNQTIKKALQSSLNVLQRYSLISFMTVKKKPERTVIKAKSVDS